VSISERVNEYDSRIHPQGIAELPQLFKHSIIVAEVLQPEHLFWLEWAQFKKFVSANYKRL
jgi:hypothetical protein